VATKRTPEEQALFDKRHVRSLIARFALLCSGKANLVFVENAMDNIDVVRMLYVAISGEYACQGENKLKDAARALTFYNHRRRCRQPLRRRQPYRQWIRMHHRRRVDWPVVGHLGLGMSIDDRLFVGDCLR
jgi:hypothetical protein